MDVFHSIKIESKIMRREPISKLEKLKLASARERLKIDAARARQVEEVAAASDVKLNQFGRPIVRYEDMPELDAGDMRLLNTEFERLACPHWAVAKYRPGFGPKNELRKLSRDSWYFYETGRDILYAVMEAVRSGRMPHLLDELSVDGIDVRHNMEGLMAYLLLETDAKREAAVLHRTTVEKMENKDKEALGKIRKDIDKRFDAMSKRRREMDPKPV